MSTTYKIIFQNEHGKDGTYSVFSSPPTIRENGITSKVYTNAWIEEEVPAGENVTFTTSNDIYAWTGTVPSTPGCGVIVQPGTSRLAKLGYGGDNGSSYPMSVTGGIPNLGNETRTAKAGSFKITTDTSFISPTETYLIGMGKVDSHGVVSPVACLLADTDASFTITPITRFYVGLSSFKKGEIIDFHTVTETSGLVDFSQGPGLGRFVAVVRHDKNGGFQTEYYQDVVANEVLLAVRENRLGEYLPGDSTSDDTNVRTPLSMLDKLSELMNKMDHGSAKPAGFIRRIGALKLPRDIVPVVGITSIVAYLAHKGYMVDYRSTKSNPKGQATINFTLTPPRKFWERSPNSDGQLRQCRCCRHPA